MTRDVPRRAGVYGVGRMGSHHARVYDELPSVDLVGVYDDDHDRAVEVGRRHDVPALDHDALLDEVDVCSVAVPTRFHHEIAARALDHDVHVLVEKPFVETQEQGRDLVERARERDLTLQVGHVERFNPAVLTLADVVQDLDVIAVDAARLGPPVGRDVDRSVALDLMIHDVDVLLGVVTDGEVTSLQAAGAADNRFVSATLGFDSGIVATLQASRVTQEKVRTLSITAHECKVNVDYIDQSVRIHRHSLPDYVEADPGVRYRHESIIEQPTVANGEPLRKELSSFVESVREGTTPVVTAEDGLRALDVVQRIDALAAGDGQHVSEVPQHGTP